MYEITYEENTCLNHSPESVGSHYDFTFENRYDISHQPRKDRIEYTFDAAMNPRTKMKLYGGVLEEDFGLTLKADKETDDGYLGYKIEGIPNSGDTFSFQIPKS